MIKFNGYPITPTMFPDGTSQIWKVQGLDTGIFEITWEFENEGELMHVAQLLLLCQEMLTNFDEKPEITLHMPFLPYGRQDKCVTNDSTFALNAFLKALKGITSDYRSTVKITTLDMHPACAWPIENVFPTKEINFAVEQTVPGLIAFPDEGAQRRYGEHFKGKFPTITGLKVREPSTGHLNYSGVNGVFPDGMSVLMVDDICDGGMTFVLYAEILKRLGAESIHLYTTHGIYSKGLERLRAAGIDRIFNRNGEVTK